MRTPSRSAFLAASGAAAFAMLPKPASAQLVKLRIAGTHSDQFGQWMFAKDAGAFARLGFDVEGTAMVNAAAVAAGIGGGSLEMGIGDIISGGNAILAGVPILLVAGAALYSSSEAATISPSKDRDSSTARSDRKTIGCRRWSA